METIYNREVPDRLDIIEKECWQQLKAGTASHRHAFHQMAVANGGGGVINLRTVVLRGVAPNEKWIAFHTDIRSGKWAEIMADGRLSALLYDAPGKLQLRLGGVAVCHHHDAIAQQAWSNTTDNGRQLYRAVQAPSTVIEDPAAMHLLDETGWEHFGVVRLQVHWMEWLWLNSAGHRRARFVYEPGGAYQSNWLVP